MTVSLLSRFSGREPVKERRQRPSRFFANEKTAVRASVLAVLVVATALWEAATLSGLADPLVVSTPLAVARAVPDILASRDGIEALEITGSEILAAFVFGTGAGVVAGIALGVSRPLREAYLPIVTFFMSTPKAVLLPIFMLGFGITQTSAAAFGAFEAFFYVTTSVVGGVGLVEERHLKVARAFRASHWQTLTSVVLPSALPGVFAALWYGMKHAFLGVLISELWASEAGVGNLIRAYSDQLDSAHVIALVGIISCTAIVAGTLWARFETRLSRWRDTRSGNTGVSGMV